MVCNKGKSSDVISSPGVCNFELRKVNDLISSTTMSQWHAEAKNTRWTWWQWAVLDYFPQFRVFLLQCAYICLSFLEKPMLWLLSPTGLLLCIHSLLHQSLGKATPKYIGFCAVPWQYTSQVFPKQALKMGSVVPVPYFVFRYLIFLISFIRSSPLRLNTRLQIGRTTYFSCFIIQVMRHSNRDRCLNQMVMGQ